ncbi:MAG: hypothetical protein ACLGIT_11610 [Gammaproteobacteria bacterium]
MTHLHKLEALAVMRVEGSHGPLRLPIGARFTTDTRTAAALVLDDLARPADDDEARALVRAVEQLDKAPA